MNLELSDEQLQLGDAVRRFLADKASIAGHVRPLLDDPIGTTDEVWQGLVRLGAAGLLVPEEHGGAGLSMVEAAVVLEELGRALYGGPWLSSALAGARLLTAVEDDEGTAKLLGGIADGSVVAAVCLPPSSEALLVSASGDGQTVTGDLPDVSDAMAADVVLVSVATDQTTTVLAIETSSPGVTRTAVPGIDPTRKRGSVTLIDAPAAPIGVLSAAAAGGLADDVLIAWAADALGAAQALLDMAVEYAKARQQFGQAIGAFQAVQHLCVDMYETVELARGGVLFASWAADHADADTRHLAALRLKGFSGRLAEVGDMAIQVLGGIGFTWEHDAHLYLRRLLSFSAFGGSPDTYLQEVGRRLMEARPTPPGATS